MQGRLILLLVVAFFDSFAAPARAATVLDVPFAVQAPFDNLASPWQDFCEEASVVMAAHFVWGVSLTPQLAEFEMQIIKKYEEAVFGKFKDTSAEETAIVLKQLYGFQRVSTAIVKNPDAIKQELSRGRIVIAPVAGRMLQNPYFIPPGPLYHMVVIRGFDDVKKEFITNDPGIRRGKGYRYSQARLYGAIHDWNGGDVIRGEKRVIVVGR